MEGHAKAYDTIRDASLTCARKPTWVCSIYSMERTLKSVRKRVLYTEINDLTTTECPFLSNACHSTTDLIHSDAMPWHAKFRSNRQQCQQPSCCSLTNPFLWQSDKYAILPVLWHFLNILLQTLLTLSTKSLPFSCAWSPPFPSSIPCLSFYVVFLLQSFRHCYFLKVYI